MIILKFIFIYLIYNKNKFLYNSYTILILIFARIYINKESHNSNQAPFSNWPLELRQSIIENW